MNSIISDSSLASHTAALEESPEGLRFREELALRERARRAFASIDNQEVLRRAMVHRSRPARGNYSKGDRVMIWKKYGEIDGQWQGPMQVVIQESHQVMWVTSNGKLYRIAPEHVGPLSTMEEITHKPLITQEIRPETLMRSIIPSHGGVQYHNLIDDGTSNSNSVPNQNTHNPNYPNNSSSPNNLQIPDDTAAADPRQSSNAPSDSHGSEQPDDESGTRDQTETSDSPPETSCA